ncbi:tetratricopeptide repeat protein [Candidatus Sumerlaeota bacterium]|nr:tetratricopeptide repeat protein [Candidatus Sumerlaeota bacterium]
MKRLIAFMFLGMLLISGGCRKKTMEQALKESQIKIHQGDLIGARIDLKEIIRKNPNDPLVTDARFLLAHCYYAERDFAQCRNHAQMIIDQFGPRDDRAKAAFELILNTYNQEQKFQEGVQETEKFIGKLPKEDDFVFKIQCMIADLLVNDNKTTDAIAHLNGLIESGKDHEQRNAALERLVGVYASNKKFEEAIQAYHQYAETYPDYEDYYDLVTGQAYFYDLMGEKEKAEEMFEKAVKGYGEMVEKTLDRARKAEFLFRQARTLELRKKYEEARGKYDVVLSEYGDTPLSQNALFAKGDSYFFEGNPEKALGFYQDQLKNHDETSPLFREIRRRIAGIMREQARLASISGETTKTLEQKTPTP